jgi:uncharacterized protein
MRRWLNRHLPSPEALRANRWLRWIGPRLFHPSLWHLHRRGIALGVAIGLFFGLLIPIAQIPLSAGAAVLLRANLPAAAASTLVTNPVTFAPVYYAAWKVGGTLLGQPTPPAPLPLAPEAAAASGPAAWWDKLTGVGKPLVLGLAIFAVGAAGGAYLLIHGLWRLQVTWRWRRRGRRTPAPAA